MEHDAFTNGVAPGGLLNSREIRVLVCYMLNSVNEPMDRQTIVEIVFSEGIANFFETEAAIEELAQLGNLTEDENGVLELTPIGKEACETLMNRLPFTIRTRAVEAAVKLMARKRRAKDTCVEFEPLETGVAVTCSIDRSEHPMMSFTLVVADREQAELVRERFLDDPVTIYRLMVSLLSGEASVRKFDNRTVIDLSM